MDTSNASDVINADHPSAECPADVVDRLLWRNAQVVLQRHGVRLDGTCRWCGRAAPCSPRRLAQRAEAVSRLPWHEAISIRNDITRLLPVLGANPAGVRAGNQHRYA